MYRPQHSQRERRAPQPHALAEMDKAHPIPPHAGNVRHPIVIRWQQVGQPSSAIATPHFNCQASTKRPAIAAAMAMAGHARWISMCVFAPVRHASIRRQEWPREITMEGAS